ncbi:MAG: hypothetical protein QG577_1771 [Thermodesulfobacteriota bacterium]|nr:hypothetical protein [Thermodesulfobacteriota bacterium]
MPLTSVVIPTYNRADVVGRALESVLGQDFQDLEIIVVDDGSTDSTLQVLEKYGSAVRVLTQGHKGVSSARNLGIFQSNGALLAFLDSDDQWLPEKLAVQVRLFDPGNPDFVCHTDEIWMRDAREVHPRDIHRKQGGRFFERALERCLISPSSVVVSRALLDKVGVFDETFPAAEDYDLWLRITAFHEVDFIPQRLVIKHGGRDDQLSLAIPAIDRFRIAAIQKILKDPRLSRDLRDAAVRELTKKCGIVAGGLRKRGKIEEAWKYEELALSYEKYGGGSREL